MKTLTGIVAAFAVGAAAMYYLDPQTGRRRRAQVRERGAAVGHDAQRLLRGQRRVNDCGREVLVQARAMFARGSIADDRLLERIHVCLRRLIEDPKRVNVDVLQGYVILRGHASIEEIEEINASVAALNGVQEIDNRILPLSSHARP